jgi:hypothetical protein
VQFSVPLSTPGSVQLTQVEETITYPTEYCQDVAPPTSATALQLYVGLVSGSGEISAQVKGDQTGANYSDGFTVVPNGGLTVPINTGVDSTYTVCWEESVGNSATLVLTVGALLSMVGAGPANVTVTCNCESGGGGAMLAYGIYTALDPSAATWTKVVEVGATMLQGDDLTFDLPTGSLALVECAASVIPTDPADPMLYDLSITTSDATFGFDVGSDDTSGGTHLSGAFDALVDSTTDPSFAAAVGGGSTNYSFVYGPMLTIAAFARP